MKYLTLLLLLCSSTSFSQTVIFDHRVEDRDFLQYYYIWNQFDSSTVMYEFGEVTFLDGAVRQNIPLSGLIKKGQQLQGSEVQGISTDLEEIARTEKFTIPGEGEIQWFGRLQSFRTPCDGSGAGYEPNKPVPNWGIVDRTEFVVQLLDATSNTVLATLDSIGVNPTGTVPPVVDTRYGTHIERVKHSAVIPASYTGKVVYVRISPRRYGPTPYGLTISKYTSWINLSAEYDSIGIEQIPLSETAILRDIWFTKLIEYCDSIKTETGWLPDFRGISFAKKHHIDSYHSRYFTPQVDNTTGDTLWHEKHIKPMAKRGGVVQTGERVQMAPLAIIQSIAPNPVVSDNTELLLLAGTDMACSVELVSTDGQRMGSLWDGLLYAGQVKVVVAVPKDISNGSYMLILEGNDGKRIANKPLIIAR